MNGFQISVNQLAEFSSASESGKIRIIRQQLAPDQFRIPWYQLPKARIKKSFKFKGDLEPVYDGMKELMNRKPLNRRQENDKSVSLEALERYVRIQMPKVLKEFDYSIIKSSARSTVFNDVKLLVAPDIVVKGVLNGKNVIGGVKIHISKNNPFNLQESQIVANTIALFLRNEIVDDETEVIPELCFCLDVFSGRYVHAIENEQLANRELIQICEKLKIIWNAA